MNLGKVEIILLILGMVGGTLASTATSSYIMGEKFQQIFANTGRIIILEQTDDRVIATLNRLNVNLAVQTETLGWLRKTSQKDQE